MTTEPDDQVTASGPAPPNKCSFEFRRRAIREIHAKRQDNRKRLRPISPFCRRDFTNTLPKAQSFVIYLTAPNRKRDQPKRERGSGRWRGRERGERGYEDREPSLERRSREQRQTIAGAHRPKATVVLSRIQAIRR